MDEKEFVKIVNRYKKQFESKYSNNNIEKQLALYLNSLDYTERNTIVDFFINEIKINKYEMWSLCLQVIVEAKLTKIAPILEDIYHRNFQVKDDNWREEVVMAMIKLNYVIPSSFYRTFINDHLKRNTGRAFFLIVQYCLADFSKGAELLSDYYSNNLLSTESSEYTNQHHLGYLIYNFIADSNNYLKDILLLTTKKNSEAGILLKRLLISFLENNKIDSISRVKAEFNIELLKNI